jgi:hypothetical protein
MLDETITSALCRLRVKIIREGLEGLPQVEALLTLRGIRLTKVPPLMPPDCQHHRGVRPVVLAALQGGAKATGHVGDAIMAARPGMDRKRAMIRAYRMLYKKDAAKWGLTPPSASIPSKRG